MKTPHEAEAEERDREVRARLASDRFVNPPPLSGRPYSDDEAAIIRKMIAESHSVTEIAQRLGREPGSVRNKLSAMGLRTERPNPNAFSAQDIVDIRSLAGQGHSGKAIAVKLQRTAQAIRAKCVELGIDLRPPKRAWHILRVLVEPLLNRAIVLAARKRGMRAGELVRRLLTAIMAFDLVDTILDKASARRAKIAAVGTQIDHSRVTPLALALQPQLQGCVSGPPTFNCAVAK